METTRRIRIIAGKVSAEAILNDSPTATKIWEALPIEGRGSTWGDEIYFSIPVEAEQEKDARDIVAVGELGYWPPGNAFCIFYGATPGSTEGEIRPASPVNPIGKVKGDPKVFKTLASKSNRIKIEKA